MFQVQLMVCCNQYWYLQQLRWFCSKLLLLLKVSYLAFESILVFLCLQGEVGRKHLQGSLCICSSLDTLSTHVRYFHVVCLSLAVPCILLYLLCTFRHHRLVVYPGFYNKNYILVFLGTVVSLNRFVAKFVTTYNNIKRMFLKHYLEFIKCRAHGLCDQMCDTKMVSICLQRFRMNVCSVLFCISGSVWFCMVLYDSVSVIEIVSCDRFCVLKNGSSSR